MVNYNSVTDKVIEDIKAAVSGKVYVGEEINIDFFHDEMPIYGEGQPDVVVDVTSAEEVSKVVKFVMKIKFLYLQEVLVLVLLALVFQDLVALCLICNQ